MIDTLVMNMGEFIVKTKRKHKTTSNADLVFRLHLLLFIILMGLYWLSFFNEIIGNPALPPHIVDQMGQARQILSLQWGMIVLIHYLALSGIRRWKHGHSLQFDSGMQADGQVEQSTHRLKANHRPDDANPRDAQGEQSNDHRSSSREG